MIGRISQYIGKIIPSSFRMGNPLTTKEFCCLTIYPQEILLACIKEKAGKPHLYLCESISYAKGTSFVPALTQFVDKYGLKGMTTSWLLHAKNYQLLLMENLPVQDSEFQSAIRWKIKDLLPFVIEDAVIDRFSLPEQKTAAAQSSIMVVASRMSYINPIVEEIKASGLNITTIDILELALRNITSLYETDEKTTALIYLQEKNSELVITREHTLYFSRRFEFGLGKLDTPGLTPEEIKTYLNKLSLEIQRSFDFYQGQWRNPPPGRIFLSTVKFSAEKMATLLSELLSVPIKVLNLEKKLGSKVHLEKEQEGKFLEVIGGALRDKVGKYETTD